MMEYKVKVTEIHTDFVWVKAESASEAEIKALEDSQCEFDYPLSSEVVEYNELEE